jgi:hypothetical protein
MFYRIAELSSLVPTLHLGPRDYKDNGSKIFQNTPTTPYPTTERRIPEDLNVQQHCCQNIKPHKQTLQFNDSFLILYKQCKHILEKCNPTRSLLLFLYDKFDKFAPDVTSIW